MLTMSHNDNSSPTSSEQPKNRATLTVDTLEARILLSATWTDADTDNPLEGPTMHNDVFHGDAGVDLVHALQGDDQLFGDAGNDRLFGDEGNDVLFGGDGADRLYGQAGNDQLDGGLSNDLLYGGEGVDQLDGGSGHDTLDGGVGDDQLSGGEGNDRLYGRDGVDSLDGGAGNDRQYGGEGNDVLNGGDGADRMYGEAGNDQLDGGSGNDLLSGGEGVDQLDGGIGNDTLDGGAGDDQLAGGAGSDRLYGRDGVDTLEGGAGNDRLDGGSGNDVLLGGTERDNLRGGDGDDYLDGGDDHDTLAGDRGNDRLEGGQGNDRLYGGDGEDVLTGNVGNDSLYGGNGVDQLDGGVGNDYLDGGSGDDNLVGGEGDDRLVGRDGVDLLQGGTGNDRLDGGADKDILDGGEGRDNLRGGTGDDQLLGGLGDDTLSGDQGNDRLVGGEGNDRLYGGDDRDELLGGLGNDLLNGGRGDDHLVGAEGNDNLAGGDGIDLLDGGVGNDRMDGGRGDDQLSGGEGNDQLRGRDGNDVLDGGDGADRLVGDAGQDVLTGGDGRDYLRGGTDDDRLEGGADNDTLVGDQGLDSLVGGEGDDRLYGGDDNDLLDGGVGNDRLDGGAGDDQLSGGEGNDDLRGGVGNDVLDGGTGTDRFYGQDGDDTILAGDGNDRIDGGNGNDTIHAGAGNNRIAGGAGNDAIHSGAGNDVINAGAGDDTINYHGGRDRIDLRGGGQDVVVIHDGNDGDVVSIVRGTSDTTIDLTAFGEDQVTVDGRWLAVETDAGDSFRVQISGQEQILTSVAPPVAVYAGVDFDVIEGEAVQLDAQATQVDPGFQFDGATVESYGGYQDASGTADVTDDGLTLSLEGNTWKQVEFPYTITEDTILEFDFRSLAQADIHGIGFDVDNGISSDTTFKLFGTQDWGHLEHDDYDGSGDWQHYRIRVGDYFTGDFDHLVFVNDHDVANADGNSAFSNLRVYEATEVADVEVSYQWEQLAGPAVDMTDADSANPTFAAPVVQQDTQLVFQVTVTDGATTSTDTVAVNVQNVLEPVFNVDAGVDLHVDEGSAVSLQAEVQDILRFGQDDVLSYGGPSQDIHADVAVEEDGTQLHISGNGWKRIDLPYNITKDTVLEFDFMSSAEGEVQGIGFDNDDGLSADTTFKLFGTQPWGRGEFNDYESGDGWKHYRIPVGSYFTGEFDHLVFANDHDVANASSESLFRNLRVFDQAAGSQQTVEYQWEQVGGPDVTLLGSDTANAQFVAPHLEQHTELVFQVTANDGQHVSTDLVTVMVVDLVSGPEAGDDALAVLEDHEGITLDVLANDYDADADSFMLTTFTQAEHGSVVYEGDGQFRYIPTADFHGADSFEYTIVDSDGLQATGTVNVDVQAVNDGPVAQVDTLQLQEDAGPTIINVLSNDGDVDGDLLNVVSFTQPEHGEIAYRGDGTFEYRPHEDYAGSDRFTYTIDDGQGGQTTAHVDVNVDAVADAPELQASSAKGFAYSQIALDIRSALADTDGSESLQVFVEGLPEDAQLSAGERLADGRWALAADDLDGLTVSSANVGEHSVSIIAKAIDSNGHEAVASQVVNLMVVAPPVAETEFNWTDDFLQELNQDDEGEGLGASLRSLQQAEELVQVGLDDSGAAIEGIPILRDVVHLDDSPHYEPFEPGDFAFFNPLSDLVDHDSTDREVEEIRQSVYVPTQDGEMNPGESDGDEAQPQKAAGGLAALWGLLRGFAGTRAKENDNASSTSRRTLH